MLRILIPLSARDLLSSLFFRDIGRMGNFWPDKRSGRRSRHTIKIDTERKTVQHLEGGIVDKIHVREGDKVVKGQPLVTLKSASVDSSVDMAQKT